MTVLHLAGDGVLGYAGCGPLRAVLLERASLACLLTADPAAARACVQGLPAGAEVCAVAPLWNAPWLAVIARHDTFAHVAWGRPIPVMDALFAGHRAG